MKPLTLLCCEDAIRDADTNAISIHNIIEEINGESYPFAIPKFCIFLLTQREKGDQETTTLKLSIINNEKELFSSDIETDFQGKDLAKTTIKFGSVPIQTAGRLRIEFTVGTSLFAEITLPVNIMGQPKMHIS